jgi:hypothetical protein
MANYHSKVGVLFAVLCCVVCNGAFGQITGNPNVTDPKALQIDSAVLKALTNKKWRCITLRETRSTDTHEWKCYDVIEFLGDDKIKTGLDSGKWTIGNKAYIDISRPALRATQGHLVGTYSIYELSDSILVLSKILTSTGDWRKEFSFRNEKYALKQDEPRMPPRPYSIAPSQKELREGEKIVRYDDGKLQLVEHVKRKFSTEQIFVDNSVASDEKLDPKDSTVMVSVLTGTKRRYAPDGNLIETHTFDDSGYFIFSDAYAYHQDKSLFYVRRQQKGRQSFIVNLQDSVSLDKISIQGKFKADSLFTEMIRITNLRPNDVQISLFENKSLGIRPESFAVKGGDSLTVQLNIKIPAGNHSEIISIGSKRWTFPISVNSFGYHISAKDFATPAKMILPPQFYFHRSSNEYQLQIDRPGTRTKSQYIPISMQMVPINLKKGKYMLTLSNPSKKAVKEIEIR